MLFRFIQSTKPSVARPLNAEPPLNSPDVVPVQFSAACVVDFIPVEQLNQCMAGRLVRWSPDGECDIFGAPNALPETTLGNALTLQPPVSRSVQVPAPHTKVQLAQYRPQTSLSTVKLDAIKKPRVWHEKAVLDSPSALSMEHLLLVAPAYEVVSIASFEIAKTISVEVALLTPTVHGKVYIRFVAESFSRAAETSRREASRQRVPDEDPFASLFFILLAKHNWDIRVLGLDALLKAYPDGKKPFPFQLEGVKFLTERNCALLADEMGLGKTIQAILAFRAAIHAGKIQRVLIICPASLLANWFYEVSHWAPELSATIVHGAEKHVAIQRPHHIYITNYESVARVICAPSTGRYDARRSNIFDLIVIDEIQNLKNPSTQKARAVAGLQATSRWGLTGTPLENRFDEYCAVWKAICPSGNYRSDRKNEILKITKGDVLRREKRDVLRDLPQKVTHTQFIELEGKQRKHYYELEQHVREDVEGKLRWESRKLGMHIFALITKLKQLCIYDQKSMESAKIEWIAERLDEMHPSGVLIEDCEKMLVFTQYSNLVWDTWNLPNSFKEYKPARYDGSLTLTQRASFVEKIQGDEQVRMAFMGLKAGGTGLTLTRASQVVFLDSWWNPAVMEQAAARIHRIGQARICTITSLVAKDTIDERIMQILDRKLALFEQIMREVQEGKRTVEDLEKLENALTIDDMLEALNLKR